MATPTQYLDPNGDWVEESGDEDEFLNPNSDLIEEPSYPITSGNFIFVFVST